MLISLVPARLRELLKDMKSQEISILIAGSIWALVGVRIGLRSLQWLEPYMNPPSWQLIFLVLSVAVGFFKAGKLLKKSVARSLDNLSKVPNDISGYLFGWLRLYGTKGVVIVGLMIGLGFLLRALKASGFDPYNIYGFVYFAVAFALLYGSSFYFNAAFALYKNKKS